MTRDKSRKNKRDNARAEAIKLVAKQFKVTTQLVRMVINDPGYDYGKAADIRKAFQRKYNQLTQILA
mgnify:CR=1 FL=1